MNGSTAPLIGLTIDAEEAGGYAPMPWYAQRKNYSGSVAECGGLPILLPYHPEHAETYLDMVDGLVVTGGDFDIDPAMFGEAITSDRVVTKPDRTRFEAAMVHGALERKIPMIGICGGEQLINVLLGGTLVQHIPDSIPDCLEHEQPNPRWETSHAITIEKDSLLHRITGTTTMQVNSSHHQAVAKAAPGMIVNAVAPDGVIEGIEYPDHPFCLGVEWHPEYLIGTEDRRIMDAFIAAAKTYRGQR